MVPVVVLQQRWRRKNGSLIEQVLIRGSNPAALQDTYEDKLALQARFPAAEAWGQSSSQGGGMSAPLHQQRRAGALSRRAETRVARPARPQASGPRGTGGPTNVSPGRRGRGDSSPSHQLLEAVSPARQASSGSGRNGTGGYLLPIPHYCNPSSCTRDNSPRSTLVATSI